MKPPIRILVVDNHAALRQALADLLNREHDMQVVGQAASGTMAVKLSRKLEPDVVVMDLAMPGMHGVAATKLIHQQYPEIQIIGFSIFANEEAESSMAEVGAFRFVSKRDEPHVLISAVRAAGLARNKRSTTARK
jgi:DNA-binding NarL/FixJ family response regulator